MKKSVFQAFKTSVEYLLESKTARTKKEIASSLGVSPSYFSEILKERINISADLIQKYFTEWKINPLYIYSNSEDILIDNIGVSASKRVHTPGVSEDIMSVQESVNDVNTLQSEEKLHPTLHPTGEKCPICNEKEKVISSHRETITALQEANTQLVLRLEDCTKSNTKKNRSGSA